MNVVLSRFRSPAVLVGLVALAVVGCWLLNERALEAASCGRSAAGSCEMTTTIVNAAGRPVVLAAVGVEVHPRVVFSGSPSPTGTVTFEWFPNGTCAELPVATSPPFTIVNGAVNGVAFSQIPRKVGDYAFVTRYSGDTTHSAAVGECQPLTVRRSQPQVLSSSITITAARSELATVGQVVEFDVDVAITGDATMNDVTVVTEYESQSLSTDGSLPPGCVAYASIPDAEHGRVVCTVGRVPVGPTTASIARTLHLPFRALRVTSLEGTAILAYAAFGFEGAGSGTPLTIGPSVAVVHLIGAQRLSLPPETSGVQGQEVVVPIRLNAEALRVPAEFQFTVTYDPALLSARSVARGSLPTEGEPQWTVTTPGRVEMSVLYAGAGAESGAPSLAVVHFVVLGSDGQGELGLVDVRALLRQANAVAIEVDSVGGTLRVLPAVVPPPPPAPAPPPVEVAEEPELAVAWDERLWTPGHVATSLGYSTLLGVALTGLAELFNSTVEENRNHFTGWWRARRRRLPLLRAALGERARARGGLVARVPGWIFAVGVGLYLLVASALFAFLEPERAFATPVIAIVAACAAIVTTTVASQLPRWWYVRRLDKAGALYALPPGQRFAELHADFWTLAFALVCVTVAYATEVRPGYAYGIVGVLALNRGLRLRPENDRGQLQPRHLDWLAMVSLFLVGVAAWLLYSVAHASHNELLAFPLERIWILGAETVALGLIPLSFLPGKSLWHWSRLRWGGLWLLSLFLYIQSVTPHAVGAGPLAIALTLLVYGAVTLGFWLYFEVAHDEESCATCQSVAPRWEPAEELVT